MKEGCLRAAIVLGLLGLACCGVTYWLLAGPRPQVSLPDLPDLPPLPTLPAELESWLDPPGGLFGVPGQATRPSEADGASTPVAPTGTPAALAAFRVRLDDAAPEAAAIVEMAAGDLMQRDGYELVLEAGDGSACDAAAPGAAHAAVTTLESVALCPEGLAIGVPIGQSVGGDALVGKGDTAAWADALSGTQLVAGSDDLAYLRCLAAYAAVVPTGPEEAIAPEDALGAWASRPEVTLLAAPADLAAEAVAEGGARLLLSSGEIRAPWPVVAFSTALAADDPGAYDAFTRAYYRALQRLADPERARTEPEPSRPETVAFASLGDAALLVADGGILERRLADAARVWAACGHEPAPSRGAWSERVLPGFVRTAREDPGLVAGLGDRPGTAAFEATGHTDLSALEDTLTDRARGALQSGVWLAFESGSDEYADPLSAEEVLRDAVRYLRGCDACALRVRPATAGSVEQARRAYYDLRLRLGAPRGQLVLVEEPAALAGTEETDAEPVPGDRVLLLGTEASGP